MLAQLQTPFGLFGKVRKQLWLFLATMTVAGALMALAVIYLAPAHEDFFTVTPETTREALAQLRG